MKAEEGQVCLVLAPAFGTHPVILNKAHHLLFQIETEDELQGAAREHPRGNSLKQLPQKGFEAAILVLAGVMLFEGKETSCHTQAHSHPAAEDRVGMEAVSP